ncbi:hypothetical protein R3P38DRAFT_3371002 [Favolaschia claudopus]|uniref:Uncharacterized protein n=1 Tax=Favolaschia claudopus TaxID=2862362 RepID=A0AAW0A1G9_9AGAR
MQNTAHCATLIYQVWLEQTQEKYKILVSHLRVTIVSVSSTTTSSSLYATFSALGNLHVPSTIAHRLYLAPTVTLVVARQSSVSESFSPASVSIDANQDRTSASPLAVKTMTASIRGVSWQAKATLDVKRAVHSPRRLAPSFEQSGKSRSVQPLPAQYLNTLRFSSSVCAGTGPMTGKLHPFGKNAFKTDASRLDGMDGEDRSEDSCNAFFDLHNVDDNTNLLLYDLGLARLTRNCEEHNDSRKGFRRSVEVPGCARPNVPPAPVTLVSARARPEETLVIRPFTLTDSYTLKTMKTALLFYEDSTIGQLDFESWPVHRRKLPKPHRKHSGSAHTREVADSRVGIVWERRWFHRENGQAKRERTLEAGVSKGEENEETMPLPSLALHSSRKNAEHIRGGGERQKPCGQGLEPEAPHPLVDSYAPFPPACYFCTAEEQQPAFHPAPRKRRCPAVPEDLVHTAGKGDLWSTSSARGVTATGGGAAGKRSRCTTMRHTVGGRNRLPYDSTQTNQRQIGQKQSRGHGYQVSHQLRQPTGKYSVSIQILSQAGSTEVVVRSETQSAPAKCTNVHFEPLQKMG